MEQFAAREIGGRIAKARNEAGFTQEDLAEMAPFSKRSLQDYEAGQTIPYKHLRDLGRLLNKPTEWFLYGEDSEAPSTAERLDRIEELLEQLVEKLDPLSGSGVARAEEMLQEVAQQLRAQSGLLHTLDGVAARLEAQSAALEERVSPRPA